jgi:hypothetical protein
VLARIIGDFLVGLHVLQHRLKSCPYGRFLLHYLPQLLEDVPLAVTARMWYMNDDGPAHFYRAVPDVLNNTP